jgi:hypothetical protein
VYTEEEVSEARKLVESGYKHKLSLEGSADFMREAKKAVDHIKTAGYYRFLRTYIRRIVEIEGFSQLREADAAIWSNTQLLMNPVDAAGFFIQKASQMKEYLQGKLYYGGTAEARSVEKRIEFLKALETKSKDNRVRAECKKILKEWAESTFVF